MSPQAGYILLDQIEPRLRATMPYIRPVAAEDISASFASMREILARD
ncbi:MAG: hypothetical protein WCS31_13940 [Verrucomicrobiae bacterium]